METLNHPILIKSNKTDSFFRKRYNTVIVFASGLLLFLLPFAEIKCGSTTLVQNSGIGIALGTKWKSPILGGSENLFKDVNSTIKEDQKNVLSKGPNIFVLIALASGLAGIVFSFSQLKIKHAGGMAAGILAAFMLVAMMIQFKIIVRSKIAEQGKSQYSDFDIGSVLKVSFTLWYFLSVASFLSAAFFCYKHYKIGEKDALNNATCFEFQEKENNPGLVIP